METPPQTLPDNPDLLHSEETVAWVAEREGWEPFHWRRWESLRDELVQVFEVRHLDLGGHREVQFVCAYPHRFAWTVATLKPMVPSWRGLSLTPAVRPD